MARPVALVVPCLIALAAAACGRHQAPVGGVSAEEAAQLDNAAEMLDASADDLAAPAGNTIGNLD